MISRLLLRALDNINPERRRRWAVRIAMWTMVGWAASHLLLIVLQQGQQVAGSDKFFQHVLLAISWAAIELTALDVVATNDVRANDE
jgi:hypothetical protein